jgi:uncharacterized protein (TIGR03437 family)
LKTLPLERTPASGRLAGGSACPTEQESRNQTAALRAVDRRKRLPHQNLSQAAKSVMQCNTEPFLRLAVLIGTVALLGTPPAEAYYHYTHYLRGPFNTPVYEKFDLNALTGKTVTFLVADSGPANFGANDDFASVLSQVKQAAIAWNGIDSSDLRVAFGGLETPGQTANGPGGDVIFTDLAPGVLGMGGVTAAQNPVNGPNGPFFPVVRSVIQLTNDTSKAPGPSYLEGFFTTAVHEMGHALGLQHTWTSAAMSQDVIRNTSRARPLDADDIAGLSVLYGKANWTSQYGSISGRVTANGQAVALASVVAIPPIGPAVSALTNPDGTYTISGLPPNSYLLYVHPLPPDAVPANSSLGLRLPVDQNGQTLSPYGKAFRTYFMPDKITPQQPASYGVTAGGATITGQDFAVTPQDGVSMYDMLTYSYSADRSTFISPAYVNGTSGMITVVAQANPPLTTPIPQSVTILGGFANANACGTVPCFTPYSNALAIYFNVPLGAAMGPRHMVFTLPNGDLYVLPDAVNLVTKDPPAISSVKANGDGTATISGSRFGTDSRVFLDGMPATVLNTDGQTSITVTLPPGYSGQNASIIVYNSDGQNSTFYQTQNPPAYAYPSTGTPLISVDTVSLNANVSSLVNITATNMQFVNGQVTVGFGTSDVSVRHLRVVNSTHLAADISVAPGAAVGASEISVISGFQVASQPGAFQIQAANPSLPAIGLPIVNADPNQAIIYPGAIVSVYGTNLSAPGNSPQISLNGQPTTIQYASPLQINFNVPANFPTGPAVLTLNNGLATSPPIEIQIDGAPPAIAQIVNGANQAFDNTHFAAPGDTLIATVSGVDLSVIGSTGRVQVTISGVPMYVSQVKAGTQQGTVQVYFVISQSFGASAASVVVTVDGIRSSPYTVIIR